MHNHNKCQNEAFKKAEAIADKKGLKLTDLRKKVFDIIWQNHKAIKAYDIIEQLGKLERTQIKPPIVYRTLDFLVENGLVHRIDSINAFVGCTHADQDHECHFLICENCNDVTEICDEELDKKLNKTAKNAKFTVARKNIEILGVCKECS